MSRDLVRWNAPEWVPDSITAPNFKAKLANTPTPIEFRDQRTVLSTSRWCIWIRRLFISISSMFENKILLSLISLTVASSFFFYNSCVRFCLLKDKPTFQSEQLIQGKN